MSENQSLSLTCEIRTLTGQSLGVLILNPKEFKSGSSGFHGLAKIELDGERFQTQCQLVRIGSKAEAGADPAG